MGTQVLVGRPFEFIVNIPFSDRGVGAVGTQATGPLHPIVLKVRAASTRRVAKTESGVRGALGRCHLRWHRDQLGERMLPPGSH
jgi:hypothetical protein